MKSLIKILSIILLCSIMSDAFPVKKRVLIAALNLVPQGKFDNSTAFAISDQLRDELFNTGSFTVIDRSQLQTILRNEGIGRNVSCLEDSCAVKIGSLAGVQYVINGTISQNGDAIAINAAMIDVSLGAVVARALSECKCDIGGVFKNSTSDIAKQLSDYFQKKISAVQEQALETDDFSFSVSPDDFVKPDGRLPQKIITRKRTALFVATTALLTAGVALNSAVSKNITEADKIAEKYRASDNNFKYSEYSDQYEQKIENAKYLSRWRNVLYVLSGVSGGAVAFSFTF